MRTLFPPFSNYLLLFVGLFLLWRAGLAVAQGLKEWTPKIPRPLTRRRFEARLESINRGYREEMAQYDRLLPWAAGGGIVVSLSLLSPLANAARPDAKLALGVGWTRQAHFGNEGYSVHVYRWDVDRSLGGGGYSINNVILPNSAFSTNDNDDGDWARGTVVHELAHVWDLRNWGRLSIDMNHVTGSFRFECWPSLLSGHCHWVYDPTAAEPPPSDYGEKNPAEDWADSIRKFIVPSYFPEGKLGPIRRAYIEEKIRQIR